MVTKIKLLIVMMFLSASAIYAQQADDIVGKYRLPNKLDVKIFKYKGKYYGKIIALNGYENGQTTDYKNPDEAHRNDPLLGKIILKELVFDEDDKKWTDGQMYGPEKGMEVNLEVTEMKADKITVVASKYFFWKTIEWTKI